MPTLLLLAAAALGNPELPDVEPNLSGLYSYRTSDGKVEQTGGVVIRKTGASSYLLLYSAARVEGDQVMTSQISGVGIYRDGVLAVAAHAGESVYVFSYSVECGQGGLVLRGGWTRWPGGDVIREELRRLGPLPAPR